MGISDEAAMMSLMRSLMEALIKRPVKIPKTAMMTKIPFTPGPLDMMLKSVNV
jgi:hypothetical protein